MRAGVVIKCEGRAVLLMYIYMYGLSEKKLRCMGTDGQCTLVHIMYVLKYGNRIIMYGLVYRNKLGRVL